MRLGIVTLLATILAAGLLAAAASAQPMPTCAENDHACRIAALEARIQTLEAGLAAATTAAAPQPTRLDVNTLCSGANCDDEAIAVCVRRGFSHGRPDEWRRDRTSLMLTRAACSNEAPAQ